MKRIVVFFCFVCLFTQVCGGASRSRQWSVGKAGAWWDAQVWPVGCNYIPADAINQFEMWQAETFNPEIIESEFGLCEELGFNVVRIFLHEDLWFADRDGFKKRIGELLSIADRHGIKASVNFCTNGCSPNEKPGPQPLAVPGVHNGGHWAQAPSDAIYFDRTRWRELKAYVQDILRTFKHDDRILYWCLFNEPENNRRGESPLELMSEMYRWAWEVRPDQPITSPIWVRPGYKGARSRLDVISFVLNNSDIITFHCYYSPEELETFIDMLHVFHRPMVCQEYMARTQGSTFQGFLPIFKREKIGAVNWGLVEGKCNFHYPWGHKLEDGEPALWFHDIFYEDHTPYMMSEVEFIKSLTADKDSAGKGAKYPIK